MPTRKPATSSADRNASTARAGRSADAERRSSDRLLLNSRMSLALGFGSMLLIMALAGVDALRVLSDFRANDDQIRRRYLFQNRVLDEIKSEVYLSGTYVRDYLLEPESRRAEDYRASLGQLHRQMDAALEGYRDQIPAGPAGETETRHYTALKSELSEYWRIMGPIFGWNSAERQRLGYAFLRDEVFPRRQVMLTIADRIAEINDGQLTAGNDQVVGLLVRFQTRLLVILIVALLLGLGLSALSIRRILKLETQVGTRYREASEAQEQLKDLSARLVQAQETERRALSRELHDEVGQSLSAVLVELRNLSGGMATRSQESLREHVETIKGLVESTIRVVRNMALLLRPSMLDDLGLIPALKWQAREVSKRDGMDVSVTADLASDDLLDEHKTCIYRVVQEALHNCSSHARASSVKIRVEQKNGRLTLTIEDDGRGFDSKQVKGLGLLGIQERVKRLGGWCTVRSSPGSGTRIVVELPVANGRAEFVNGSAPAIATKPVDAAVGSLHGDNRETDSHPAGGRS